MLMSNSWRVVLPRFADISADVSDLLDEWASLTVLEKGALIFGPDNPPTDLLLLVSGSVRVQQQFEDGRKIVLNRMHSGDNCVLTTACLLASNSGTAEGIAETDVEAIKIPREVFDTLMSISRKFRAFVFEDYSRQITDLFLVIEDVVLERMDIHVAKKLLEHDGMEPGLRNPAERFATELGTTREVILRQINDFERRGWLRFNQGEIELRDVAAIERVAQPPWLLTSAALSPANRRARHLQT